MQYAIPQFTDVEDKLIGPLTLKQFLAMLGTGGLVMFFWSILGFNVVFFLFALPVAVIGLALTFGTFNSRPMFVYAGPMFNFFTTDKVRIFKRLPPDISLIQTKKTDASKIDVGKKTIEAPASRLKRLAYLLDQKTEEENKLISQS